MQLTKHHALGNDFLIVIDPFDRFVVDADVARAACDRHRGLGADGIIRVSRGSSLPFRMELHNEDGSRAEMSGNGISCMAQAIVRAGHAPDGTVRAETDAGPRVVQVLDTTDDTHHRMRVAMGEAVLGAELPEWTDGRILRAVAVDVGNPHVVCHLADPTDRPDLVELGERVNAATFGGANVEVIEVIDGGIAMVVYERGVGPTEACGTGAVAAATAAHAWGLAPATVTVAQPGGSAIVEVGQPAHLQVPVTAVAAVEWWR